MASSASKIAIWSRALDRVGHTDTIEDEADDKLAARVCGQHYDDLVTEVLAELPWKFARKQAPLTAIDEQTAETTYSGAPLSDTIFTVPFFLPWVEALTVDYNGTELVQDTDYTVTLGDPAAGTSATITLVGFTAQVNDVLEFTVSCVREGWDHVYELPADCVTPMALLPDGTKSSDLNFPEVIPFDVMSNDEGSGQVLCCSEECGDGFDVLEYTALITQPSAYPRHFVDAIAWRLAVELAYALNKDPAMAQRCAEHYRMSLEAARAVNGRLGVRLDPETPSLAARR